MKEKTPLKPIIGSKNENQQKRKLENIWVDANPEPANPMNNAIDFGIKEFFESEITMDDEIIRLSITDISDNGLLKTIDNMANQGKRFYILTSVKQLQINKDNLKKIAGKVLLRFVKTVPFEFVVSYPQPSGVLKVADQLYLDLDAQQSEELAQWFNWQFGITCELEVSTLEELDSPVDKLSYPFDPQYPVIDTIRFVEEEAVILPKKFNPIQLSYPTERILESINTTKVKTLIVDNAEKWDPDYFQKKWNIHGFKTSVNAPCIMAAPNGTYIAIDKKQISCQMLCNKEQEKQLLHLVPTSAPLVFHKEIRLEKIDVGNKVWSQGDWKEVVSKDTIDAGTVDVPTENMVNYGAIKKSQPEYFPDAPETIKTIVYQWEIHPPYLNPNAKPHNLHKKWESFEDDILETIETYKKKNEATIKKSDSSKSIFSNIKNILSSKTSSANSYAKKLDKLATYDWIHNPNLNSNLEELEDVCTLIDKSWKELDSTIRSEEIKLEKKKQEEEFKKAQEEIKTQLSEAKSKRKEAEEALAKLEKEKASKNKIKKAKNALSEIEKKIERFEAKLNNKFEFIPTETLANVQTEKKRGIAFFIGEKGPSFDVPLKPLPKSGRLYTHNKDTYLAISSWDDLELANKEKDQYFDAKVVSYPKH